MTGILYSDLTVVHIAKLQAMLDARDESYTAGVQVANSTTAGASRMVTVVAAGGLDAADTIDTEYHAVNVYAVDEADAADLASMVRALITSRGPGTLCDGNPIVFTAVNAHPVPVVPTTDGSFRWRMVVELRRRGVQL